MKTHYTILHKNTLILRTQILLFVLLTVFVSAKASYSQSTWFWQQPLPTGNEMQGIYFPTAQTGFTTGTLGTIEKTTDGGESWIQLVSGVTVNLSGVFYEFKYGYCNRG
ncbi:MAG: hypothetical protein IPL53_06350 [Ignavibacteria bacterium]|nr:hypothetical protein [Ignavibacteria bacterium]